VEEVNEIPQGAPTAYLEQPSQDDKKGLETGQQDSSAQDSGKPAWLFLVAVITAAAAGAYFGYINRNRKSESGSYEVYEDDYIPDDKDDNTPDDEVCDRSLCPPVPGGNGNITDDEVCRDRRPCLPADENKNEDGGDL
jgi:hypothetical protein